MDIKENTKILQYLSIIYAFSVIKAFLIGLDTLTGIKYFELDFTSRVLLVYVISYNLGLFIFICYTLFFKNIYQVMLYIIGLSYQIACVTLFLAFREASYDAVSIAIASLITLIVIIFVEILVMIWIYNELKDKFLYGYFKLYGTSDSIKSK